MGRRGEKEGRGGEGRGGGGGYPFPSSVREVDNEENGGDGGGGGNDGEQLSRRRTEANLFLSLAFVTPQTVASKPSTFFTANVAKFGLAQPLSTTQTRSVPPALAASYSILP